MSTNPKDVIGNTKLPLHLWPAEASALGCLGMLEGALKYGRNNFIAGDGVVASIYVTAAIGHLQAWQSGEELTTDTNADHLGNAIASIAIIIKARAHGKLVDDRDYSPAPGSYRKFIDSITTRVTYLKQLFADRRPKHYTIADNTLKSDINVK